MANFNDVLNDKGGLGSPQVLLNQFLASHTNLIALLARKHLLKPHKRTNNNHSLN